VSELEKKLSELKELAALENPNLLAELEKLSEKLSVASKEEPLSAWQRVQMARNPDRPTTLDYIQRISESYIELHGDRTFGDDPAMVGGIARIGGVAFTFIGHQKGKNMKENLKRNGGMAQPEGYRKALRLAEQAAKFHRPILSFIDTAGAFPGVTSEERGVAEAIARNMKIFSTLNTPIISIVSGEGGSGGAIGIGVGDRIFMLENAYYAVITPEGCASILLRDAKEAPRAAGLMKLTSYDLKGFGIVDAIIPEPVGGAQSEIDVMAARIKEQVLAAYRDLSQKRPDILLKERSKRLLEYGQFRDDSDQKSRKDGFIRRLFNWS